MRTDIAAVRFCANSSKMSWLPYSPFCLLREIRKANILIHFLYLSVKTIWPRNYHSLPLDFVHPAAVVCAILCSLFMSLFSSVQLIKD